MPRKRMIDPGIWTNEDFGILTAFQQILYTGLISNADDEGRIKGSPQYLKAVIFPYKSYRDGEITEALEVLGKNLIKQYSVKGTPYIQHPNWLVWQKVEKPYPSKLPPPDGYSPTIPRPFPDHSPPNTEQHNAIQTNPKQHNTTEAKPTGMLHDGYRLLLQCGVSYEVASALVKQYDEETIQTAIRYARDKSVKNKAAYVVSCLRKGYV